MDTTLVTGLGYVVASGLFIFGLKMLGSPATARRGNMVSATGMLIAIVVALLDQGIVNYTWIAGGMVAGGLVGAVVARSVAMTSMPEMVALFNGLGGSASLLVGWAALTPDAATFTLVTIVLSILIGGVTLTGSLIAYGKLSEKLGSGQIVFSGQQIVNSLVVLGVVVGAVLFVVFVVVLMRRFFIDEFQCPACEQWFGRKATDRRVWGFSRTSKQYKCSKWPYLA